MNHLMRAGILVFFAGCFVPPNETIVGRVDDGGSGNAGGAAGGQTSGGIAASAGGTSGGSSGGAAGGAEDPVSCSIDHACWEGQAYRGTLNAVHGTSASFVVAVGENGVVATWNGASVSFAATPTRKTLRGVWFASPQLGWAVGDEGTVLEWNGSTWQTVSIGTTANLTAIHGAGATVFIGGKGVFFRRVGTSWVAMPDALPATDELVNVSAIAVESSTSAYLVGTGTGFFLRQWDGTTWSTLSSASGPGPSSSDQLYSVSVCGGNVFVSGNYSGEFHASWSRRAGTWETHYSAGARSACVSATEYVSFGSSYYSNDRLQLVTVGAPPSMQAIGTRLIPLAAFAAGPRDVFFVGAGATFTRWTGAMLMDSTPRVTKVVATSATNVLRRIGTTTLERRETSGAWTPVAVPGTGDLVDFVSPAEGELWVLRAGPVAHHLVSGTWTSHTDFPAGTQFVRALGPSEVWFSGGSGAISKWTGTELLTYFTPVQAATGPVHLTASELWLPTSAATGIGLTYRRAGGTWTPMTEMWAYRISGVQGAIVFSSASGLARWSNGQATIIPSTEGVELLSASNTHVFFSSRLVTAQGSRSVLRKLPLTSSTFTELDLGTSETVTSLSATSDGHVWLTTTGGGLLHLAP